MIHDVEFWDEYLHHVTAGQIRQPDGTWLQEDLDDFSAELCFVFNYSPGRRAVVPRGEYLPLEPDDPPEVDDVRAFLVFARGTSRERNVEVDAQWAQKAVELPEDALDVRGAEEAFDRSAEPMYDDEEWV